MSKKQNSVNLNLKILFILIIISNSCLNSTFIGEKKLNSKKENYEFSKEEEVIRLEQRICYNTNVIDGWSCDNLVIEILDKDLIFNSGTVQINKENIQINVNYDQSSVWNWEKESVKVKGEIEFLVVTESIIKLKQKIKIVNTKTNKEINFLGQKVFKRKIELNEIQGIWKIDEIYIGKVKQDPIDPCNYQGEITIEEGLNHIIELDNYKIRGKEIGKANYRFCSLNPETLEFEIVNNACSNIILQDNLDKRIWYELGENALMEFNISYDGEKIIMIEKKDFFDRKKKLRTIKLKKKN